MTDSLTSKQKLYEEAFALLARADVLLEGIRSRHEAHLTAMLAEIDLRFTSGNAIPVERASVKAPEWAAIRQYIAASLAARSTVETNDDTARMDWLQARSDLFANIDRITSVNGKFNGYPTLREAIDNARRPSVNGPVATREGK